MSASDAKCIVVKVGTSVVSRPDGSLALGRIGSVVEQIAQLVKEGRQRVAAEKDEKWNRREQLNVLNAARRRDGDRGKHHEPAQATPEAAAKEIAAREEFLQKRAGWIAQADKEREAAAKAKADAAAEKKRQAQKAEGARRAARSVEFRAPKGKAVLTLSTVGEEWTAPSEQKWTATDPNTIGLGDALLSCGRGEAGPSGVHDDASVWESVATSDVPLRHTQHSQQRGDERQLTLRESKKAVKHGKVRPGNRPGTFVHEYRGVKAVTNADAHALITHARRG